jgi:ADP-dependent NAD(P)H-hydrate dehydratase / NAD(P)H-hydrate epimerase
MVLARANPLVLDADALNHIASTPDLQRAMDARAAQGLVTVLTPHPLEAARLLEASTNDIQNNRLQSAQTLSKRWQCITVLKGSGTVVADTQGVLSINGSGNALLATAGTGDVLAGMVGAALARHGLHADHVRMAVYAHGRLADTWPRSQALSATRLAQACMPTARTAF